MIRRVAETPKESEQIKGLNSKYTFFMAGHQTRTWKSSTSLLSMRVYIHIALMMVIGALSCQSQLAK